MNARDIVAAAFTAAREPEYEISEQEDYDDADIAVTALEQAGIIQATEPEKQSSPSGAGLNRNAWLVSLRALFLRMGIPEEQVRVAMTEAMLVFDHAELIYGISELDAMSVRVAAHGRDHFGLGKAQEEAIQSMIVGRTRQLEIYAHRVGERINNATPMAG